MFARRFPRQFSLRALLVAVTLLAVILGYWVYTVRQQQESVAAIHNLGGSITFDHEIADNGVQLPSPVPRGPSWLRERIGEHHFDRLVKISFGNASDEDLAALRDVQLNTVEHLLLVDSPVTDVGLRYINSKTFPNLRRLRLDYTKITDEGLAILAKNLPYLEKLYVSYTSVGDVGIEHLSAMNKLEFLDVTETKVNSTAIARLKTKLPQLKVSSP